MYKTVYLKGKYAPGGQDWIHLYDMQQGRDGISGLPNGRHDAKPIFFPWANIERIE